MMAKINKSGFKLDASEFLEGLDKIDMRTKLRAQEAFHKIIGPRVIRDAIEEEPRAPHLTGHLWRNQKFEMSITFADEIKLEVGFNVPYAAALHEMEKAVNWTLAGSGPKYLESKLIKNKDEYYSILAKEIWG